jgi:hypothetical protein
MSPAYQKPELNLCKHVLCMREAPRGRLLCIPCDCHRHEFGEPADRCTACLEPAGFGRDHDKPHEVKS